MKTSIDGLEIVEKFELQTMIKILASKSWFSKKSKSL